MYSPPLTYKAIPFIYKRGCTPSPEWEIDFFKLRLTRSTSTLPTAGPPSSDRDPFGQSRPNLLYTPFFLLLICTPTIDFEHLGSGIKSPTDPDWT